MDYEQNPMTAFTTLETAFSQGFRMSRVPFTEDTYFVKDKAYTSARYTYAKLKKLKVQQTSIFIEIEPLNKLPCFCLYYGTLESLRGKKLTIPFISKTLERFKKDLPKKIKEFYIETIVDCDNEPSLSIARKLFGEPINEGKPSAKNTIIWQTKVIR